MWKFILSNHGNEVQSLYLNTTQQYNKALIIFQGIQGIGKTTLAEKLICELYKQCHPAVALETDNYKSIGNTYPKMLCLQDMVSEMQTMEYDIILLMRMNRTFQEYKDFTTKAKTNHYKICAVTPLNFEHNYRLLAVCLYSLRYRTNHQTIQNESVQDRQKAYKLCLESFNELKPCERNTTIKEVIEVDWLKSVSGDEDDLSQDQIEYLQQLLEDIKTEKNQEKENKAIQKRNQNQKKQNQNAKVMEIKEVTHVHIDAEVLEQTLNFDQTNYHSWRKDGNVLAKEIADEISKRCVEKLELKTIKDEMLYMKIPIEEKDMKILKKEYEDLLKKHDENDSEVTKGEANDDDKHSIEDFDKKVKVNLVEKPHVTMIFQSKLGLKNQKIWDKLLRLKEEETIVRVIVYGVAILKNKVSCFRCHVSSKTKGTDLGYCIRSQKGHITYKLGGSTSAETSVILLNVLDFGEEDPEYTFHEFKQPILLYSKVEVEESKV